jgi:segregation and condensation protein B
MTTLDMEEFRQAQRREETPENKLLREASRVIEALLFASARPLGDDVLQTRLPVALPIARVLEVLQADYRNRGVQLVRLADGWMFRTAEDLGYLLSREAHETRKLSRAALETLSVIAYHQPVTRAEIEDIRGVSIHRGTLDALLETGWIRLRGRRRTPGRPVTYGTTEHFLIHFGLETISDLPGLDDLKGAGFLDGRLPQGFSVPMPSDNPDLTEDEDPLGEDLFTVMAEELVAAEDAPLDDGDDLGIEANVSTLPVIQ